MSSHKFGKFADAFGVAHTAVILPFRADSRGEDGIDCALMINFPDPIARDEDRARKEAIEEAHKRKHSSLIGIGGRELRFFLQGGR